MEMIRTNLFFGIELDKVNEMFMLQKPVCGYIVFLHPDVAKNSNFPDEPIRNCDAVKVNYMPEPWRSYKILIVTPGEYILRVFDTDGGDIENVFGKGIVREFIEETYDGKLVRAIILGKKDEPVKIEWSDKDGQQLLTTINMETDEMKTIPNPEPVATTEDED